MATTTVPAQRAYSVTPNAVFGACVTVLGQMRADIRHADAEQGEIIAQVGQGWLARISELRFQLRPAGDSTTQLLAYFRPVRWGGDALLLTHILQMLDTRLPRT